MIRALTVSQPFADMIGEEKYIENRTWYTSYRGPIAIHAGSGKQYLSSRELKERRTGQVLKVGLLTACISRASIQEIAKSNPQGIVGIGGRRWLELFWYKHAEGPVCWLIENVIELPMAEYLPGKQGLWKWFPMHEPNVEIVHKLIRLHERGAA